MIDKNAKIYIAGHTGLVGSALVRGFKAKGYNNLILRTHRELNLTRQLETEDFFAMEKPDYVINAAALVGGINANSKSPADFFYVNMAIADNLIWSAVKNNVRKFLYLGSACMYPRECKQPMIEEDILNGIPEPTNEGYALAKIGGSRLCSYIFRQYGLDFISAIPANAYGLNDCFDPVQSHVIPALIMKYHKAKCCNDPYVTLWGTGKALREFLYTDDLADACIFLLENYSSEMPINIGTGEEISILGLSEFIREIVGYTGEIKCDTGRPDGMLRRMVSCDKIQKMGWKAKIPLKRGLEMVYSDYLKIIGG